MYKEIFALWFCFAIPLLVRCRILKTMDPVSSKYHLIFSEELFNGSTDEYQGIGYITFSIYSSPVTQVQFYADLDYITLNHIYVNEYEASKDQYHYNTSTKIVNLTFSFDVISSRNPQQLLLYVNFTSKLSTQDTYGIYRAKYDYKNIEEYFLATNFQPIFARRVIPCWDEPTYRSNFEFYISHPDTLNVLANQLGSIVDISEVPYMEDSTLVTTHFNSTPSISPHNLAFIISKLTCTSLEDSKNTTSVETFRLCSKSEDDVDSRVFALKKAEELIEYMNNYTGWAYSLMGVRKLDFVAIPNTPDEDCTPYWGLIVCSEELFLANETELSHAAKIKIIKNLSRQLAQMWFGNMITLQWWSDKFLYMDAFAGYFEYFFTNEVYPEMDLNNTFITQIIPKIFEEDCYSDAEKLQGEVYETDEEILTQFLKEKSYKGAALIHMIKNIMGSEPFKIGLQNFISSNKNKSPIVMNFWNMLNPQIGVNYLPTRNTRLYEIMDTWTTQAGFPLVEVRVDEGSLFPYVPRKIVLSQKRYLENEENNTSKWFIPVTYTFSSNLTQFSNSTPKTWLNLTDPQEIRYPWTEEFAVFDNQLSEFYIAYLDNALWTNITNVLSKGTEYTKIPELSRTKILQDAFEMVKTDQRNYTEVLSMVEYLKNEDSIYPWRIAIKEFNFLLKKLEYESVLGNALRNRALTLMSKIYQSVSWTQKDQDYQYIEKKVEILTAACEFGHQDCIDNALGFKDTEIDSSPDFQNLIYCTQLKYEKSKLLWNKLRETYATTVDFSKRLTLLESLSCIEDEELLSNLLSLTILKNGIATIEEGLTIFKSVILTDNAVGSKVTFSFLKNNYEEILKRYGDRHCLKTIVINLIEKASFWNHTLISEVKDFIQNSNFPETFKTSVKLELQKVDLEDQWLTRHLEELYSYYQVDPTTSTISTTTSTSTTESTTSTTTESPPNKACIFKSLNVFLIVCIVLVGRVL